jgi:hypothetical protein
VKRDSETPETTTPKSSIIKKTKKRLILRLPFHLWDAVDLASKPRGTALDKVTGTGGSARFGATRPTDDRAAASTDEDSDADTKQSTADSNARRGLRTRRPAQKRPYFHDAQLFEDADTSPTEIGESTSTSPGSDSRQVSVISLTNNYDEALLEALDEEMAHLEHSEEGYEQKPKHFKGKGRAWKKDGSDEDEEFTPKKKAAKAKADAAQASGQKKRGRPRKIPLPEDTVRDRPEGSMDRSGSAAVNKSPASTPTQPPKRGRGRPRKSALSAEIVQDDSSDDERPKKMQDTEMVDIPAPPPAVAVHTPKKRGRPRKSDQSTTPASIPSAQHNEADNNGDRTDNNDTPSKIKSVTPKPMPKESERSISAAPEVAAPTDTQADSSVKTQTDDPANTHDEKPVDEVIEVETKMETKTEPAKEQTCTDNYGEKSVSMSLSAGSQMGPSLSSHPRNACTDLTPAMPVNEEYEQL